MSKHVIDQPRTGSAARLGRFLRIARSQAAAPVPPGLARRKRVAAVARMPVYLRIARQMG
jgi:hypothetical protein